MESYEILWDKALKELQSTVSAISYSTYIEQLKPIDLINKKLILATKTEIFASEVASRLLDKIRAALRTADTGITDIELCVGDTVSLSVEGRGADGGAIDPDALSRRGVEFFCRAENGTAAFRVNENGVLTALSPGIGNVRAVTRDGKVSSRAVTVIVRDADGQNPAHLF